MDLSHIPHFSFTTFYGGYYGFPRWLSGKETCNARAAGDTGSILGREDLLEEGTGNPLQCSCLENPMDRGAWQATVQGSQSQTRLSD